MCGLNTWWIFDRLQEEARSWWGPAVRPGAPPMPEPASGGNKRQRRCSSWDAFRAEAAAGLESQGARRFSLNWRTRTEEQEEYHMRAQEEDGVDDSKAFEF
eukprot:794572-Pyramimonas_sp.AAC.1